MKNRMRMSEDLTAATFRSEVWVGLGEKIVSRNAVIDTLAVNKSSPLYKVCLQFNEMTEWEFTKATQILEDARHKICNLTRASEGDQHE